MSQFFTITCWIYKKWLWLLEQQIEEYERVEQEKMKERNIANKKFLERMRQDESMQQFDG